MKIKKTITVFVQQKIFYQFTKHVIYIYANINLLEYPNKEIELIVYF